MKVGLKVVFRCLQHHVCVCVWVCEIHSDCPSYCIRAYSLLDLHVMN